ncbi:MAG: ABC transporter permease [bacterium]|jgi:ABC-2 type transport system permease protein|nr:ABC transporter permease [bacterium]
MGSMLAIAIKDLRLLLRDRAGLFFTMAFPFIYALFFGAIFSPGEEGARRIPLRLVDLDGSPAAAAFLDSLAARPGLDCRRDSLAGAEQAVRRGWASAALILPPGFGQGLVHPFRGQPVEVELLHDPVRRAEAGLLQGLLMEQAFRGLAQRFQDPRSFLPDVRAWRDSLDRPAAATARLDPLRRWLGELDRFLVHEAAAESLAAGAAPLAAPRSGLADFIPLRIKARELSVVREGPRSYFEISFPQGLLWGLISVAATFGVSLVVERKEGTLRRLRASRLRRRQILGGKALACAATVMALALLMLVAGLPLGVRAERPLLLLAAIPATAAAFTGLMLLVSVLGRTERSASGIGWSLLLVLAMLGGGMVPLFMMPEWMRVLGNASPVKWAILAFEGVLWRGFGWAELWPVCAILCAFGAAAAAIGLRAFRWNES